MRSCYRCGKSLPDGRVECIGPCTMQQAVDNLIETCAEHETKKLVLCIELGMDEAKVKVDPQGYAAALSQFTELMSEIVKDSGLINFMKKEVQ